MDIDLSTDTAPSPERTLQLAEAFAEILRTLNHLTRHHEALGWPSDADRLIREISTAADRLPQLLAQVSAWLEREYQGARIEVPSGWHAGDPEAAVADTASYLREAGLAASGLSGKLAAAARVTSTMTAAGE